ncbi:alpha/beta fold hydrolase [Hymenobacter sp. HMF4947]|uniref:Alpha/beta fold hydrolase n=1 Tax=Hymenobacter ginkgonis TaxID=2682976 RepID=A0A7K1TGK7_9BACT|nr:alpha/beta fold hydrolase [Hymenobacter ginkgonis]MVN77538.1 alpha/beta fold hydrolase [Hymenobacter ginkgonis]
MKPTRLTAWLVAVFLMALGAACSKDEDTAPAPSTYVLVHGAWQAPYAWQYVQQQLVQQGQHVLVVELPGHGADPTPPATLTLDAYRDKVVAAITAQPDNVILVGHSMGGMVVTAVAEKIPDRIRKLVYIGAFLPANGQSLLALAATDSTSHLGAALVPSADQLTLGIKPDRLVPVFIQDGSATAQKLVTDNYCAEPAIPFTNPVALTAANFGRVAKYYVHTSQDQAVGLRLQQRMAKAAGITHTYTLNSGHCPFLSMPDQVSNVLLEIAH